MSTAAERPIFTSPSMGGTSTDVHDTHHRVGKLARARERVQRGEAYRKDSPIPQLPAEPSKADLLKLPGLPRQLEAPGTEEEREHLEETLEVALLLHRCNIVPERVAPTADNRGYVRLSFNDIYRLILNAEEE